VNRGLIGIVDYHSISPLRVGATSGAACRKLAPEGARIAGIIGSSRQARGQLQAIARTAPGVREVRIFSPNPAHRAAFAKEMSEWLGIEAQGVASAHEAVSGADVVALAANTSEVVLDKEWVKRGALVLSIGGARLPTSIVGDWRSVFTTWEHTSNRYPYAEAVKAGTFTREHMAAELAEVILEQKTVRRDPEETVVFECGVLNYWAVAVAHYAYEWAQKNGFGTQFALNE
jgi:ornithine cyclodeaminase/alanine dehydrogenase-like protein (mu-crystallin family)